MGMMEVVMMVMMGRVALNQCLLTLMVSITTAKAHEILSMPTSAISQDRISVTISRTCSTAEY